MHPGVNVATGIFALFNEVLINKEKIKYKLGEQKLNCLYILYNINTNKYKTFLVKFQSIILTLLTPFIIAV